MPWTEAFRVSAPKERLCNPAARLGPDVENGRRQDVTASRNRPCEAIPGGADRGKRGDPQIPLKGKGPRDVNLWSL